MDGVNLPLVFSSNEEIVDRTLDFSTGTVISTPDGLPSPIVDGGRVDETLVEAVINPRLFTILESIAYSLQRIQDSMRPNFQNGSSKDEYLLQGYRINSVIIIYSYPKERHS